MAAITVDLERELNPQQLAAVTHAEGPQLVLAGAGSGKTRVITHRVYWLAESHGVDPSHIVAVTFTNKAAAEMRERVERLLAMRPLPTFVGTFHRLSLWLLRRWGERVGVKNDFVIFDSDDQLALIKKALVAEELSETAFPPRTMLSAISSAKNRLLTVEAYESSAKSFFEQRVARVYARYQGALRQASAVDFDDMLMLAVTLLERAPALAEQLRRRVRYLMVDEFQDTNHAQLRLVLELVGSQGNITAVGDEDQGIYRWRGADLGNVLEFERSFPGAVVRKLERNYRSTQNILTAAGDLVAHNRNRRGKRLWTDAGPGEQLELYRARDEQDEARWVVGSLAAMRDRHSLRDMGILVRTNAQTRALEEELLRRQIPYVLVGGVRFYDRAEIKDLVAYLRVLRNPRDSFSLARIINQPPRGIGKVTQEMLQQVAAEEGLTPWDLLVHDGLGGFSGRSAAALEAFRDLILELERCAAELSLAPLLELLLDKTGYLELYRKDDPEGEARIENLREFISAAQQFSEERGEADEGDELTAFLDHVSLVNDLDAWDGERGVSLMTLHSAKGLEFPLVVISGLEEGLLPHFNAGEQREDIEEERRLLYVGMTRARERLLLSTCRRRRIAGRYQDQLESRFLAELPADLVQVTDSPELRYSEASRGVYSFFDGAAGSGRAAPGEPGFSAARRGAAPAPARRAAAAGLHEGPLRPGARVRHPTLGRGVVLDVEGDGESAKLTVFFDSAGKRKLVARYAALEIL